MSALATDAGLARAFLRQGGGARAALVTACTALVSGLILVAVTVALWPAYSSPASEQISNLVSDEGVRGGYVLALLLICLAPLVLLRQVLRLGNAAREQRLAALRVAGATPADVRRIGAFEVGLPALLGGLLGYPVFLALRAVFGSRVPRNPADDPYGFGVSVERELRLIPTSVDLPWWVVLLVALAVGLLGAFAGATVSRAMAVSPYGVSRRGPASAPRPWAALLVVLAVAALVIAATVTDGQGALVIASVGILVLGLLGLAPWVAHRIGRAVAARASRPHVLVAARRLAADARPAGRAASTVGVIALIAGGGGVLLADLPSSYDGGDGFASVEAFYLVPIALGGVVLLVALALVVFSMAVHGAESLTDSKRSVASLSALGVSRDELSRIQRWEVGLVALPMAALGVLVGSGAYLVLAEAWDYAWIPLLVDVVTLALVWLAVILSTRLTRPWLVRAASPANLRTP